ncbi:MAG: cupin domain-containing protein [Anaerotignum sp.]
MELQIGSRLRELRNKKKLSIAELSKNSDVSTGLISQIERDLVVPSVVNLWRLANALDTNINYFFEANQHQDKVIIRKGDHKTIVTHRNSSHYKLLSPTHAGRLLDFTEICIKSGCDYEKDTISHQGEECGYVLKGTLTVHLNGKDYTLYEGDSICFNSILPHKYMNHSDEDCISIWTMTPAFF